VYVHPAAKKKCVSSLFLKKFEEGRNKRRFVVILR